ncbi:hypothetical protein [Paenibacillus sp. NPDC057967]|uniref:hypothetical protein n=1 Tax=Paenibacillus sp. NPDC057967 TaxID=3346293 RepID=UPI0036DC0FC8
MRILQQSRIVGHGEICNIGIELVRTAGVANAVTWAKRVTTACARLQNSKGEKRDRQANLAITGEPYDVV